MDVNLTKMITILSRKNLAYIGHALESFGLTAAEQPFFMGINRNPGMTQEELTGLVCVDKAATARAIKSLEEKGLLTRVQDERDRRQNHIYPTEKARELYPLVHRELLSFNERLSLCISDKDLKTAALVLDQMGRNLSELMEETREKV